MSWQSVIGQQRVKDLLARMVGSGRVPSALLFEGPEGVGKDAAAIELAKVLNCERGGTEACGECSSCIQAAALQHPNIQLVFPLPRGENETKDDGALAKLDEKTVRKVREEIHLKSLDPYHKISIPKAQVIKISSIREVIREDSLSLYQHGRRVIIIMRAEEAGIESANAILKVLEEPTPGTVFILTTSRRSSLLSTIISRCQPLRFDLLTESEVTEALVTRYNLDPSDAALKARLSGGSYIKAVDLIETDTLEVRDQALDVLREIAVGNYSQMAGRASRMLESRDPQKVETLLRMLQIWLRDVAIVHNGARDSVINRDKIDVLEKMEKSFNAASTVAASASVDTALSQLDANVNLGLLFVNLLLTLSGLLNKKSEAQHV